jgi:hypothetical protein
MIIGKTEGIYLGGSSIASTNLEVVDDSGGIYGNGVFGRSGTTAVRIASSTGQLYQKSEALTFSATNINNVAEYNAYSTVTGSTGPLELGGICEVVIGGAVAGGSSEGFFALPATAALGGRTKILFSPASSSCRLSLSAGASSNSFYGSSSNAYLIISSSVAGSLDLVMRSSSIWWWTESTTVVQGGAAWNSQTRSGSTT